jgi:hypothetical protein
MCASDHNLSKRPHRRRGAPTTTTTCLHESEGISLDPGFLRLANPPSPPPAAAATTDIFATTTMVGSKQQQQQRPSFSPLSGSSSVVVTVTTLRHPVDRVLSLYWYEHVGWWDGIQHDLTKLKPLNAWLEHWR